MPDNKVIEKINYNGTTYEVGIQSLATSQEKGLMSPTDKMRLDNMEVSSIAGTAPISVSTPNDNGVVTISHNNSNVTANTYGTTATTALTPAFGATFSVPGFTVNASGHVTAAGAHTVKIPATTATSGKDGLMSKADKANFDLGVTIAGNTVAIGGDLAANTLRTSLGLSTAMHFIGIATVAITDGSTTNPTISGYSFGTNGANAQKGDVVIDKDSAYEFVWTGSKWERLGPDGSYALSDHTHANATSGAAGFMSAGDKATFDSIPATYVKKAGDTMTGGLTLTSQSSAFNNYGIVFSSGGKIGGNTSGDLGIYGNNIYLRPSSTESSSTEGIKISASDISPTTSESVSLGTSSLKYSAVYATNFYGSGANLTSLNASNLSSGTVPIARIPTGTTSSTVALGNHTHTASLATDTGTSAITLAYGGKYKLTAGGSSVIFTMPANSNTDTKQNIILGTTNKAFITGVTTTPTATVQALTGIADTGVYLTTTAGEINAAQYKVNEKAFMYYDTTTDSVGFTFI